MAGPHGLQHGVKFARHSVRHASLRSADRLAGRGRFGRRSCLPGEAPRTQAASQSNPAPFAPAANALKPQAPTACWRSSLRRPARSAAAARARRCGGARGRRPSRSGRRAAGRHAAPPRPQPRSKRPHLLAAACEARPRRACRHRRRNRFPRAARPPPRFCSGALISVETPPRQDMIRRLLPGQSEGRVDVSGRRGRPPAAAAARGSCVGV